MGKPNPNPKYKHTTPEERLLMIQLYEGNRTLREVAVMTKRGYGTVHKVITDSETKMRPGWRVKSAQPEA